MTLIVAVEYNKKIYMGCDSMMSDSNTKDIYDRPKMIKKKDLLFGYAGSFILDNVLRYTLKVPGGKRDERWLHEKFIPELKKSMNNKMEDGEFLMGFSGKVYFIQEDFSVIRSKRRYISIGSGNEVAFGALHATKHLEPKLRIKAALKAASEYCLSVGPPFHYMEL